MTQLVMPSSSLDKRFISQGEQHVKDVTTSFNAVHTYWSQNTATPCSHILPIFQTALSIESPQEIKIKVEEAKAALQTESSEPAKYVKMLLEKIDGELNTPEISIFKIKGLIEKAKNILINFNSQEHSQTLLFELLETACQKLNRTIRFYRQWEIKEGADWSPKQRAKILSTFDDLKQKSLNHVAFALMQLSRELFPFSSTQEQVPTLSSAFEETREIFTFYHTHLQSLCKKDELKEIASLLHTLFTSNAFFKENSPIKNEVLAALSKVDTLDPLKQEAALKEVFKLAFSVKAPFLHSRMSSILQFEFPEKFIPFFRPLFIEVFKQHYMRTLNLSWKNGSSDHAISSFFLGVLAEAGKQSTRPLIVSLENMNINDKSLVKLSPLFESRTSQLLLKDNQITKKGMIRLAELAKKSQFLQVLDLTGNHIRDDKTEKYRSYFPKGLNVRLPEEKL